MTTERTPLPTTPPTVAHDSATCQRGLNGEPCLMCKWAAEQERQRRIARDVATLISDNNFNHWRQEIAASVIERSAATIRARRDALLERADMHSPTEGAIALADAHLQAESWFQQLPNNAMQDAAVLELAGRIESAIGEYVDHRQKESDQCD